MQYRQVIFEQSHINRIALEPMLQNKQMYANIIVDQVKAFHFIFGCYLLLSHFIASFNLLNKTWIIVFHIAFFKDNWCHFMLTC